MTTSRAAKQPMYVTTSLLSCPHHLHIYNDQSSPPSHSIDAAGAGLAARPINLHLFRCFCSTYVLHRWAPAVSKREVEGGGGSRGGWCWFFSSSSCCWRRAGARRREACSRSRASPWREAAPTISWGSCRGPGCRRPARRGSTTPSECWIKAVRDGT
jgi:hypothetical protein